MPNRRRQRRRCGCAEGGGCGQPRALVRSTRGIPLLTSAGEVSCRVRALRCPAGGPASPPEPASAGSQVGSPPSSMPGVPVRDRRRGLELRRHCACDGDVQFRGAFGPDPAVGSQSPESIVRAHQGHRVGQRSGDNEKISIRDISHNPNLTAIRGARHLTC